MKALDSYMGVFGRYFSSEEKSSIGARIPEPAIIKNGSKIKKLYVAVGDHESGVPHFHVFRSEGDMMKWRRGAPILFLNNCYYHHFNNREILTIEEFDAVITLLKKINVEENKTNWRFLVEAWNEHNDHNPIDPRTRMPLYKNIKVMGEFGK